MAKVRGLVSITLEENKDYIIKSYQSGEKSTEKLAKKIGCSPRMISLFLKKNNVCIKNNRTIRYTQEQYDKIEPLYKNGMSAYKISSEVGVGKVSVEKYIKKLGYDISVNQKKRVIPLKTYTDEIIKEYQGGVGCYTIANKYNCQECNILKLLRKNNVQIRSLDEQKYKVDETFFSKIDNEFKAYTLGFLYADGNVEEKGDFRLAITDLDPLEKIKIAMQYEGPILLGKKEKDNHRQQYVLNVGRSVMRDDLLKLGCGYRKTYNLKFPIEDQVPKDMLRHFIRGFFDGDGSITFYQDRMVYQVNFVGLKEMIEPLKVYIESQVDIHFSMFPEKVNDISWKITNGSNRTSLNFLNWLYADSQIHMDRKYNRYLELKTLMA